MKQIVLLEPLNRLRRVTCLKENTLIQTDTEHPKFAFRRKLNTVYKLAYINMNEQTWKSEQKKIHWNSKNTENGTRHKYRDSHIPKGADPRTFAGKRLNM